MTHQQTLQPLNHLKTLSITLVIIKDFKHLLVSSRQADVFRSLTNVSREMMLNNSTRKRGPLAQKIRESKHPEIVADFTVVA